MKSKGSGLLSVILLLAIIFLLFCPSTYRRNRK